MRFWMAFGVSMALLQTLSAEDAFDPLAEFETMEPSSQELLEGFEALAHDETQSSTEESSALSLSGEMALKSSYGYRAHSVDGVEYSGFNQAQSAFFLELDYKLSEDWSTRISGDGFYDAYYDASGKDFNKEVLKSYETQLRFDDVYLQGNLSKNLDTKLGRQIVVWGKSDSIRITDVINPLDNRLPGITDIKDLRLSTTMAKFDYYSGDWNFCAMAIFENRIFLEPAPRGEFFPVDALFSGAPRPFLPLAEPKNGFEDLNAMQYAFAANGVFSGWDLSLYGADVLDSRWHLERRNTTRAVKKVQMLGTALNVVQGSWLLKSEAAYFQGLRFNATEEEKSRFDALLGFEYMGIQESVLSLEVANRHLFGDVAQMSRGGVGVVSDFIQKDEVQTALRATRSFQNDSLNATLLLNMFGHHWEYGGFLRASLEYDIADGISANVGIIDYINTSKANERPLMEALSNNDRLFMDITYSF